MALDSILFAAGSTWVADWCDRRMLLVVTSAPCSELYRFRAVDVLSGSSTECEFSLISWEATSELEGVAEAVWLSGPHDFVTDGAWSSVRLRSVMSLDEVFDGS